MKKILLTGASGFFCQSVIEALQKSNNPFEVMCITHRKALTITDQRFHSINCDLHDHQQTKSLVEKFKPTHLVHLAWYVPPQNFWHATENFDWLYSSIKLFQAFCAAGGEVFIGAGTIAEYSWESGGVDETSTPLVPKSIYGQTKKSLHELAVAFRNQYYPQVKILWPRIGYFFGQDESKEKLIAKLIYKISNNLPIDLAAPDFARPYANVKYFGDLITNLVFNEYNDDLTFNMSAEVSYSLKTIVDFVITKIGNATAKINYHAYPSAPTNLAVKAERLKEMGLEIPDTFFADLEELIEANHIVNHA